MPVDGAQADLDRFAGEWVGGYASAETGRQGTIVFRLGTGDDSVRAVVFMIPRATEDDRAPEALTLVVHHVDVTGRTLRGVLARYDDPEWRLPLETSFGGTLVGDDHIEGFFRAVGTQVDTIPQTGHWWATRSSDRPLTLR